MAQARDARLVARSHRRARRAHAADHRRGNAPLAFRIKAADFFGKLLDAIQPVAPASDDGVRGIDETLRKLSGDD